MITQRLQTRPLMLLGMLSLCLVTSCQTPISPLPSDTTDLQKRAVEAAISEFCRGQMPRPVEATPAEYDAAPEWVRKYVNGNNRQWREACDADFQG